MRNLYFFKVDWPNGRAVTGTIDGMVRNHDDFKVIQERLGQEFPGSVITQFSLIGDYRDPHPLTRRDD